MKRKLPPERMLNSLRRAQKQHKEQTEELRWKRRFENHRLNQSLNHFEPDNPVHILLKCKLQQKNDIPSLVILNDAIERLSRLHCIYPQIDMGYYDLEMVIKKLNFKPAPSRLPEIYAQILDNPYSVFVDLIFSKDNLALTLVDFPLNKDSELQDDLGDEESINLAHHLPLSNAIFLTHFDLNRFCEEVTQEKFNSRMNLKEFAEFEQKFVYRKESALEYGVINRAASRFGLQIFMIQDVLKHTQTILDILLCRFTNYYRCSGGFYPRFFSDRPTMMFYSS